MKPSILILCVNYRNDAETNAFVRTAIDLPCRAGNIVVISNSPSEESGELESLNNIEGVQVLFPEKNLGYFGAAAYGLSSYLAARSLPDWIIVCNTDIEFPDPAFFCQLAELYTKDPPAVIGPDILLVSRNGRPSSRTHQNPHFCTRPIPRKMRLFVAISRNYFIYAAYELLSSLRYAITNILAGARRRTIEEAAAGRPRKIYAPFGAFIVFHRQYFEAGGHLNYGSFLFGEEIFVAETARRLGTAIVYDPRLRLCHREHGAMLNVPSRQIAHYAAQSARYLVRTYFSD